MSCRRAAFFGIVLAAAGFPGWSVRAQQPLSFGPPTEAQFAAIVPHWRTEEYLLLGNATRGAGEPMIAVDPTNPRNMVAVAMANLQQLGGKPLHHNGTAEFHAVAGSTVTDVAVTHDGGATWKLGELPALSGKFTRCPDAFVSVTREGTFLAGCEPRETSGGFLGESALVISTDKGRSWGRPVPLISDYQLTRFAKGLRPLSGHGLASPWDRPFLYVDDSTGVIYGQAGGGLTHLGASSGKLRSQAYLTASTDGGHSFGTVYAWDSDQYPEVSRGLGMAAAHGTVAVVYFASSAPGRHAPCPCAVFGLSRNRGQSFQYRLLPRMPYAPAGSSSLGRDHGGPTALAADPTRAGRYAVLEYDPSSAAYQVIVTENYGRSWSAPVTAGTTPQATLLTRPAFQYARSGVLALIWRAVYPNQSYDIWAAISKNGGHLFSRSLRVSHARSPAVDPYRNAGLFGDDIQDLALSLSDLYVVWADNRAGFQAVWLGRAPLSEFQFAGGNDGHESN
jgi:hypothetical protein